MQTGQLMLAFLALSIVSSVSWFLKLRRNSPDVCLALLDDLETQSNTTNRVVKVDYLYLKQWLGVIFIGAVLIASIYLQSKLIGVALIISSSLFILGRKYFKSIQQERLNLTFQQSLPLLMERLVMTIESGHDVISGLKLIVNNEGSGSNSQYPLVKVFGKAIYYTEHGFTFTESLREVSNTCSVISVKHVLIHLALAYEQGGELVVPLRELSDATQLQYQEQVEERIAKLPVKATLPLLLLFAGLIILFVTPPVLEVLKLTAGGKL